MAIQASTNKTICHDSKSASGGIWHHSNPLLFSAPLLLVQLTLITLTSRIVEFFLKPLGQPSIVSQILGGVVLGPTVLGYAPNLVAQLFPETGQLIMETFATFGITLFLFSMGVKMDATLMFRPEKTAISIGLSMYIFTMVIPLVICFTLIAHSTVEDSLKASLPVMVASQSFVAFPAIACLLAELKIMNTEVGRLAVATSMFYTLLAMMTCAFGFTLVENRERGILTGISAAASTLVMAFVIVFVVRPLLIRYLRSDKANMLDSNAPSGSLGGGDQVNRDQITCMFLLILVSIFVSEAIGQHYFLGPIILGLSIPDGSPVGGTVVSKIDAFVSMILYPTFLTISGLKTNLYSISPRESWITGIIILVGAVGKMVVIILPALRQNVPIYDAFVLSLVLNARGINELILYNLVYDAKKLDDQEFAMMVMSIVLVTAVITPLIRVLYDPSRLYLPVRRMTIQHARKDTEMRIVVCIHQHQHDNIPTMVNLLEASCASLHNPLAVIVLILVEVVGQSAPMLLAYRPHRTYEPSYLGSNHISNAFHHYEKQNKGNASVQVFSNKSHISAMHDDVCRVAVDKRATLVIIPFHKQWAIDGTIGSVNRSIRAMNRKIIECAPCSLGIIIDRGPINGRSQSILNSRSIYHVAVLFLGGADDVEALAYGSRMASHNQVIVTVIRFLLLGHDNSRERKRDTDTVDEYRRINAGNGHLIYREELVKDGVGLSEVLRGMGDNYDLIIVGRNHQNSPLLFGLYEWSECPELGVVGDLLASHDAGTTASVLVIQQQQKPVGKVTSNFCLMQNDSRDKDWSVRDESYLERTTSDRPLLNS